MSRARPNLYERRRARKKRKTRHFDPDGFSTTWRVLVLVTLLILIILLYFLVTFLYPGKPAGPIGDQHKKGGWRGGAKSHKYPPGGVENIEQQKQCALSSGCPDGFIYLAEAAGCYSVILEALTWTEARLRCSQLLLPDITRESRLAVIQDRQQDMAVIRYIKTNFTQIQTAVCKMAGRNTASFYVNSQRSIPTNCSSAFVWKPTNSTQIRLIYSNWVDGKPPDCQAGRVTSNDSCLHYSSENDFQFSAVDCESKGCAICQYTGKSQCWSSPCLNGGTCVELVYGYTCGCTAEFFGFNCEIASNMSMTAMTPHSDRRAVSHLSLSQLPNISAVHEAKLQRYDCKEHNPCSSKEYMSGQFFFKDVDRKVFIECSDTGECFEIKVSPDMDAEEFVEEARAYLDRVRQRRRSAAIEDNRSLRSDVRSANRSDGRSNASAAGIEDNRSLKSAERSDERLANGSYNVSNNTTAAARRTDSHYKSKLFKRSNN